MTGRVDDLTPSAARQQLVDRLTAKEALTQPHVIAALRTVPRHLFAPPGTSMRAAYADDVVVTKKNVAGATSSSTARDDSDLPRGLRR